MTEPTSQPTTSVTFESLMSVKPTTPELPVVENTQPVKPKEESVTPPFFPTEQNKPTQTFDEMVKTLKQDGTVEQKSLIYEIETYMEGVKPGKPVEPLVGYRFQVRLYTVLINVLQSNDFKPLWNLVLGFYNNNKKTTKDVFHEVNINRFFSLERIDQELVKELININTLIINTCDPTTRKASAKKMDVNKSLPFVLTEEQKNRVGNFYR